MDRSTVFTKTAKGLMEATGKTSALARDMRAILKEIDGKATVRELQDRLDKVPEAKLEEALKTLAGSDFIREFTPATRTNAAPPSAAADGLELDFTSVIPPKQTLGRKTYETTRQQALAAAEAEAAARAKAEAEERARAVAASAAARARAEVEAKAAARAKAEAEVRAKTEAEARAKAEAEARVKRDTEERARREAEARLRVEAEVKVRLDEERKAREEAERKAKEQAERERKEAEEKSRREADALRTKLEQERRAREEAERKAKEQAERERKEAEEKARREADALRAELEQERRAREEAERKAKEQAERERKEAEEKARREADALRAKLEQERRAREEAERKVKEQAERERKEVEEKMRREADELRARLEEERKVREDAERRAKEEADRMARDAAETARAEAKLKAQQEAEERARKAAADDARREAEERERREDAERARREADEKRDAAERAQRDAEEKARKVAADDARREAAERERREAEERGRREAEEKRESVARAQRDAEEQARKAAADDARREAEERERREAEERSRKETEQKREAEEQLRQQAAAKPRSALDDLVKVEFDLDTAPALGRGPMREAAKARAGENDAMLKRAEEKARNEAGEKARVEAEKQRKREAEDKTTRDAEQSRRKDKEEQQRKQTEDKARAQPEASEREYAEEQARLDAQNEETERHFAEMEKQLAADEAAGRGQKERPARDRHESAREMDAAPARIGAEAALRSRTAEAEVEAPRAAVRTPIKWGKPAAWGLFLLLALGLVLIHFVSFGGQIPQFEKLAGGYLRQPVQIKALHLSLVPQPHWRLDGVSVGREGELVVAQIKAVAELGTMFGDKKVFKSIELESPVLSEQGLVALLFGKPQAQDFKLASVVVNNGKLSSKNIPLPALNGKIALGDDGAWQKIALETPDRKTSLQLESKGGLVQLEIETNAFTTPFGAEFILENFVAKGALGGNELKLSEFKGAIFGGYVSGNASLKWGTDWSLGGEFSVRAIEPVQIAPALVEEGKLEGKAVYAMRAKTYDTLFATPRMEGNFAMQKGALLGVDLGRLLQGGGVGGKTIFTELSGSFLREGGKTQLRQLLLAARPLSASGSADVDAGKNINGRFAAEINSPVAHARANVTVSGTLREPRFHR